MSASLTQSLPQSSRIESTQNNPLTGIEGGDTPEHPQPGTNPVAPILGAQERSATLESLFEALSRTSMPENATLSTPLPRAATSRTQEPPSHRHPRLAVPRGPVVLDPIVASPNAPMAVLPPSTPGNQRPPRLSIAGRILMFFGYGRNNRARKELVSVIWALVVDFSQIVAIITLLTISTHRKSPTSPNQNEWDACNKPLGIWNALWVVRLSLDVWLSIWRWSRERTKRLQEESTGHADNEGGAQTRTYPNPTPRRHGHATQRNTNNNPSDGPSQGAPAPYPRVYARLSLMGSTFTLVWFVLAQIFVYSSTHTCRHSSPHLWWLTFGVLSVMYLMILEVVLVAILVFVIGPILFLFWSILLLCLGRHPSQNPHHFTPDIGQLPRSVVEKIPLVLYIPPPPDQPSKPVTVPSDLHTYPPKAPDPPRRFPFFGRRATLTGGITKAGTSAGKGGSKRPLTWEDNWEKGVYPFVQLDGHRASCAICLLDFQEPKRVSEGALKTVDDKSDSEAQARGENEASTTTGENEEVEEVGDVTEQTTTPSPLNGDNLRLQDAGQGAQPLRLLKCGHVFHKTCVDPWLIDVSGRCPVCQRPVRTSEPEESAAVTDQDARPSRRRWFRRSRRRGPA